MKPLVAVAICLFMLLYAGKSLSESDAICCTWVNSKYEVGEKPQKISFHYDGTFATYQEEGSTEVFSRGTFRIAKKWSDTHGDTWYQILMNDLKQGKKYQLARVSGDGKSLDFVCNTEQFPTEINTGVSGYCSYLQAALD